MDSSEAKHSMKFFSVSHGQTAQLKGLNFLLFLFYVLTKEWTKDFPRRIQSKNDRNGGIWQRGISKSLAEYVQLPVRFINVQSSLHENVVFSVCAPMDNAAYIIFIMWNSISSLKPWYHFRFIISCGVAVTVRSHQKFSYFFKGRGA